MGELVDGWLTTTIAHMYKAVCQNDLLQDPEEGVNYFKNTQKNFFLKGSTNVYLYRLFSFFNHRRQNNEFLIFTSKFEILLMRLKAAWMDLVPVHTAQSPEFIAASEPRLQICCPQTIQKCSGSTSTACRQETRTRFPSATISLRNFSSSRVSCQISREKD